MGLANAKIPLCDDGPMANFDPVGTVPRGWLTKEGHIFKTWKQRYFCFSENNPGQLTYFDDVDGNQRGSIMMTGATVMKFDDPNMFGVQEQSGTVYILKAMTREECDAWIHGLAHMAGGADALVQNLTVPPPYVKNNQLLPALLRIHKGDAKAAFGALVRQQSGFKRVGARKDLSGDDLYIHAMHQLGEVHESEFIQIFEDASQMRKVELLRILVELDETIPEQVLSSYRSLGSGCYLTCDELNQGTMYLHWSKEPVEDAIGFFAPNKAVPEHKFKRGGKSQLQKQIRGPMIKNYYRGWTMFCKEAKAWDADLMLLKDEDIQVQLNQDNGHESGPNVTQVECCDKRWFELEPGKVLTTVWFPMKDVDAAVALPHHNMTYDGVRFMSLEKFVNEGVREGASMTLTQQKANLSLK